jgi:hypothetical protein
MNSFLKFKIKRHDFFDDNYEKKCLLNYNYLNNSFNFGRDIMTITTSNKSFSLIVNLKEQRYDDFLNIKYFVVSVPLDGFSSINTSNDETLKILNLLKELFESDEKFKVNINHNNETMFFEEVQMRTIKHEVIMNHLVKDLEIEFLSTNV